MDVESQKTIDEAIDRLAAAIAGDEAEALAQIKPVLQGVSAALQVVLSGATANLGDILHGLLDRINGTEILMTNGGLELVIPPRK